MDDSSSVPAPEQGETLRLATDIVAAYVSNNAISASDVPGVIRTVHDTLKELGNRIEPEEPERTPAVPVRKSVTPEYIVCLEDGKKLKMLKRYLRSQYGLTPEEYRARWSLPADYPMVAPNYAEKRSQLAKEIGLGRTASQRTERGGRRKSA